MSFTSALTGGLIGDAPNYSGIAQRSEKRRQGIVNLGMDQINAIFGGGSAPFYTLAANDPFTKGEWKTGGKGQTFYTQNKKGEFGAWRADRGMDPRLATQNAAVKGAEYGSILGPPGTLVGSSLGGVVGGLKSGDYTGAGLSAASGGMYPLAQKIFGLGPDIPTPREITNKRIRQGLLFNAPETKSFEGFQEPFFQKRAQDYVNYALPQLGNQYRTSRDAMLYGLENRGLGSSSIAEKAKSALERTANEGRQTIADTGLAQADQLRRDVEGSKQQAIQQLYQTADPAQAVQSALASASSFQRPSAFTPLTNMFGNLANQFYINQALNNYRQPYGLGGYGGDTGYGLGGSLGGISQNFA